jgi:hypothetical protein
MIIIVRFISVHFIGNAKLEKVFLRTSAKLARKIQNEIFHKFQKKNFTLPHFGILEHDLCVEKNKRK